MDEYRLLLQPGLPETGAIMSSTDTGYSWQFPGDSTSFAKSIGFVVRQILARVDTVKLVQVTAVHPGQAQGSNPPIAGTVDVQILVNQIDGATPPNAEPHGIVYGLPYFRLRFGGWEVSGDPAVNDIGLAAVSDRDISAVKSSMKQSPPGSQRRFSISDGIYLGGLLNGAPTSWLWLKSDGTLQVSDSKGNVLTTSSNGFALTGNVAVTGNITATGDITAGQGGADQVGLRTHKHGGVTTGAGTTLSPTPGT